MRVRVCMYMYVYVYACVSVYVCVEYIILLLQPPQNSRVIVFVSRDCLSHICPFVCRCTLQVLAYKQYYRCTAARSHVYRAFVTIYSPPYNVSATVPSHIRIGIDIRVYNT